MRGLKTDPTANVIIRGHAFIQNLRRGTTNSEPKPDTIAYVVVAAFHELTPPSV